MNDSPELTLEGCWLNPRSYLTYLEQGHIHAQFKNNSGHIIEINAISCHFQTEDYLPQYTNSINPMVSIRPHHLSTLIVIPFAVELSFSVGTNYLTLDVSYRHKGSVIPVATKFEYPSTKYAIINPVHPPEAHFFISHKDPQDTVLSAELDRHLRKIGFLGYVAENDKRLGLDFWREKILPGIDTCVALIVLWTSNAAEGSKNIVREVNYARKNGKRIIAVVEKSVEVPKLFHGQKEYTKISGKITKAELIRLAYDLEKTYRTGGY